MKTYSTLILLLCGQEQFLGNEMKDQGVKSSVVKLIIGGWHTAAPGSLHALSLFMTLTFLTS